MTDFLSKPIANSSLGPKRAGQVKSHVASREWQNCIVHRQSFALILQSIVFGMKLGSGMQGRGRLSSAEIRNAGHGNASPR
jgi:hypothetical protein